ncbi:sensor histidine kinase [Nonomuraea sp. NEAU-A123]|uniref:sensor histidine kinase n=1 Tax=Nonomuraea sp. NEAU-A123 TaxID=2839649 RepID=UPI001BE3F344|nr:histidine kinase [Nonomuraea sp. NEAU-A123]MBT2227258.1 sensor histidine kinase [Nonomuraea sp. NEAU-A123]
MKGKRSLPDTIAPGWLVVQVFGTLFVTATLVTARESTPWVWGLYGLGAGCWLLFMALDRSRPGLAAASLGAAALLPAVALGAAEDSSALLLTAINLARFAALSAPPVAAIMAVSAGTMALAVLTWPISGEPPADAFGHATLLLAITLIGVNHRQHVVRREQAEQLLEQTRLAQAEQARAATLDERTRIAREIHDVLAHSLGALGVQLELAEAMLAEKGDVATALATVRRSRGLAADGLAEARNAVAALRQDIPSLAGALAALAEVHRRDHRAPVDFHADGVPRGLSSAATVSLLGTAREALTNAAKHAPDAPVSMTLDFTADMVRLRVRNPLRAEVAAEGGFGLTGMRERLALAGGTLRSGHQDGSWHVTAEVPE